MKLPFYYPTNPAALLLFFGFSCQHANATCDLSVPIGTTSSSIVSADSVTWSGCGAKGTSIQTALNHVNASGGGSLKLTGPGALLVNRPLNVPNRTMLFGDPNRAPYGMRIIGENTSSSCAPGGSHRHLHCPIIQVHGQSASASSNVTIWNLEFDGSYPGKPLSAAAISIKNSSGVQVIYNRIQGARRMGITTSASTNTRINLLTLEMVRSTTGEPEGGAGVWINQSFNTILENSFISGMQYYLAGLPSWDSRSTPGAAPVMDLVASYGSTATTIRHNVIRYGNTAGVYLAACESAPVCNPIGWNVAREYSATIWDNDISYFRQHGIDIANTDQSSVLTNRVSNIGDSALALANAHYNTIKFNTLSKAAQNGGIRGVVHVLWGSTSNIIASNHIYGSGAPYSVYFAAPSSSPYNSNSVNNRVTGNSIWRGNSGHFGGVTSSNTIVPNSLY